MILVGKGALSFFFFLCLQLSQWNGQKGILTEKSENGILSDGPDKQVALTNSEKERRIETSKIAKTDRYWYNK